MTSGGYRHFRVGTSDRARRIPRHAPFAGVITFVGALTLAVVLMISLLGSAALAAPITVVDDQGADDEPGQKDLNFMTVDYGAPGATTINVQWGWDDTATSGANTRDACTLFDTDGDGKANYSFCVTVQSDGTTSTSLYVCTQDSRTDRCGGPSLVSSGVGSSATTSIPDDSDPFGVPSSSFFDPSHVIGNTCDDRTGCYTKDTVANATIVLADFGSTAAKLLNVCSYPSREPNSDPSDCVVTPNNGFLTIVKVANPNDGTTFQFNLGAGQRSSVCPDFPDLTTCEKSWTTTGSGMVSLISFAPGTTYDLSEVIPSGWQLDSASCQILSATPTMTGTPTSTGVDNFEIQSGLETRCTFNDSLAPGQLTVIKHVVNDNGGTAIASDFTMNLGGTTATTFPGAESPGTTTSFPAGTTFDVTETGPSGYSLTKSGDCSGTIVANQTKVCTITNDDIAAQLIVIKHVVNDHGGAATAANFTMAVTGTSPNPASFAGAEAPGTTVTLNPGSYNVTETGPSGYAPSFSADCTGSITIGQTKTCTVTNDDIAAQLIVIKHVVNDSGGSNVAGDFTMSVTATSPSPLQFPGAEAPGITVTLNAGSYNVTESGHAGYASARSVDCTGSIAVGETKTCTVTNDDVPRVKVQVNKTVSGGPVPSGLSFQFQIRAGASVQGEGTVIASGSATAGNGGLVGPEVGPDPDDWTLGSGQTYPLLPGTYQLCEKIVNGYTPSFVVLGQYGTAWFHPGLDTGANTSQIENQFACFNFIVSADSPSRTEVFSIDNRAPGLARTIGFWKNWTGCDGKGKQDPVLDRTISNFADNSGGNPNPDIRIGNLFIEDDPATSSINEACTIAVDLLDKRQVGNPSVIRDKAKAASDPVYNAVAQLVAYELNRLINGTGSGSCAKAQSAADLLQRFLVYLDFRLDGTNSTYTQPSSSTERAQIKANLNYLAEILDDYNNNSINDCGGPLALPFPTKAGASSWEAILPPWPPGTS